MKKVRKIAERVKSRRESVLAKRRRLAEEKGGEHRCDRCYRDPIKVTKYVLKDGTDQYLCNACAMKLFKMRERMESNRANVNRREDSKENKRVGVGHRVKKFREKNK
jgi:hypothetical protein